MDYKFFIHSFGYSKNEIFLKSETDYDDKKLISGDYNLKKPLKLKIDEGNEEYDFLRLQDVFNFVISQKVFDLLIENKITGWQTYDIELNGLKNKYYGFKVIGKSGEILKPKEVGPVEGIEFDLGSWSGEDFFIPKSSKLIFCSGKVKKLFVENKISNIEFESLDTFEWFNA